MAPSGATGRRRSAALSEAERVAEQKRAAATAAAELVQDGMRLGLGTGTTVAFLLPALAARARKDVRCVATSPATEREARALGLRIGTLEELGELDLAIDGADQIDDEGWLIKGGGGAHTREKIVAAAARRFVVIASHEKAVASLAPPVPLELLRFGVQHTLIALAPARLRDAPPSPDDGLIADYFGAVGDPRELACRLGATAGVVEHGLFPPEMVSTILIAGDEGVRERAGAKRAP
ncbi:MAG TPA: ribose 5-phosphate isomerase A [Solirubrobacteraceae bacterium]|nr:ribose 5-phosphate isomerase A [Solirubrobacteraceae bacterium]